jgi:hypothetical protein
VKPDNATSTWIAFRAVVVTRRQIDRQRAPVRIAERIVAQHAAVEALPNHTSGAWTRRHAFSFRCGSERASLRRHRAGCNPMRGAAFGVGAPAHPR